MPAPKIKLYCTTLR